MAKNGARSIVRDASGNFAVKTALLMPILLGCVGVGIDLNSLSETKSTMQGIADSASLAAAAAMTKEGYQTSAAESLARSLATGQAAATLGSAASSAMTTNVGVQSTTRNDGGIDITVNVGINYSVPLSPFMRFLGKTHQDISVASNSTSSPDLRKAVSMYLVLDKSGSMQNSTNMINTAKTACDRYSMPNASKLVNNGSMSPCMYYQIEALQNAVSELLGIVESNDADHQYIRIGAVAYDASAKTPSPLAWERTAVSSYVKNLIAKDGTASTGAFKIAYDALSGSTEANLHAAKNGLTPKKYIVFMTDGANNNPADDTNTLALCSDARSNGMTVYSIAFNAPASAKTFLQKCASSTTTYFDADDAAALTEAFRTIGRSIAGNPTRLTN